MTSTEPGYMKFILFIIIFFTTAFCYGNSRTQFPSPPVGTMFIHKDLFSLKIKDIEKLTGRKFTLKEKIQLKFFQLSLRKYPRGYKKVTIADTQTNLSFIMALIALIMTGFAFTGITVSSFLAIVLLAGIPLLALLSAWFGFRSIKRNGTNFKNLFSLIVGSGIIILSIIIGIGAFSI